MTKNIRTKEELIAIAKQEFLDKGYEGASLRSICNQAGVTTGAIYFFFKNKDELFQAVVGGTLSGFMSVFEGHIQEEMDEDFSVYTHKQGDHDDIAKAIIEVLYKDHDAAIILISKASGSSYEHVIDTVIEMTERYMKRLADKYAESMPGKKVDKYMLHYLSHAMVESFVHLIMHVSSKSKAERYVKKLMEYHVEGWLKYVLTDK